MAGMCGVTSLPYNNCVQCKVYLEDIVLQLVVLPPGVLHHPLHMATEPGGGEAVNTCRENLCYLVRTRLSV